MLNEYPFLTIICIVALTHPITVFVHEMGHAIAMLFLTRDKVIVFLGSYGDKSNSFRIKIGLLEIWFFKNPLIWKSGLCVPPQKEISLNKQIIYTLMGPCASFILALLACLPITLIFQQWENLPFLFFCYLPYMIYSKI